MSKYKIKINKYKWLTPNSWEKCETEGFYDKVQKKPIKTIDYMYYIIVTYDYN